MLGAITGDTIGSVYEFDNIKTAEFPLFNSKSRFTDDSVMTIAVAHWLTLAERPTLHQLESCMLEWGCRYPSAGYGGGFRRWLFAPEQLRPYSQGHHDGQRHPYGSFGNGSAMRVSACGWYFDTLRETLFWAEQSAIITHDHPEGIKGAQATAAAIFMARTGSAKQQIKDYIEQQFGYDLSLTCDQIRPSYSFNESCQGTVPQALTAFLESHDFESCLRLGVSLGGDTDTLCAIACSVAEAFYGGVPLPIAQEVCHRLPADIRHLLLRFATQCTYHFQPAVAQSLSR